MARYITLLAAAAAMGLVACNSDSTAPKPDLTLNFCTGSEPLFVAYQNGTETSWHTATVIGGAAQVQSSTKTTIAAVLPGNSTLVLMASGDELNSLGTLPGACATTTTKSITGTVASVGVTESATIDMGGSHAVVTPPSNAYSMSNVSSNADDLLAMRFSSGGVPNKLITRRFIAAGTTAMPVLDFSATEAVTPATNTITVSGQGSDAVTLTSSFRMPTASGTMSSLSLGSSTSAQVVSMPATNINTGGRHETNILLAMATLSSTSTRSVQNFYPVPSDKTLTFGASVTGLTILVLPSTPYPRLRTTFPSQADYPDFASVTFSQPNRSVRLIQTKGWTGGTAPATWDMTIPDLTGVTGFPSSVMLQSGTQATFIVEAHNGRLAQYLGAVHNDNETIKWGTRTGSLTAQ